MCGLGLSRDNNTSTMSGNNTCRGVVVGLGQKTLAECLDLGGLGTVGIDCFDLVPLAAAHVFLTGVGTGMKKWPWCLVFCNFPIDKLSIRHAGFKNTHVRSRPHFVHGWETL